MFKIFMMAFVSGSVAWIVVLHYKRTKKPAKRLVKHCIICRRRYPYHSVYCSYDASLLQETIDQREISPELLKRLPELQAMSNANDGE